MTRKKSGGRVKSGGRKKSVPKLSGPEEIAILREHIDYTRRGLKEVKGIGFHDKIPQPVLSDKWSHDVTIPDNTNYGRSGGIGALELANHRVHELKRRGWEAKVSTAHFATVGMVDVLVRLPKGRPQISDPRSPNWPVVAYGTTMSYVRKFGANKYILYGAGERDRILVNADAKMLEAHGIRTRIVPAGGRSKDPAHQRYNLFAHDPILGIPTQG